MKVGVSSGSVSQLLRFASSILDRPEWQLAPVPVFQWHTVPENHDAEEEGGQGQEETQQSATHGVTPVVYCVLSDYGYYLTQAVKTLLEETAADLLILDRPILGAPAQPLKGLRCAGASALYTRRVDRRNLSMAFWVCRPFASGISGVAVGITASAYGVEQPDAACLAHFDLFFNDRVIRVRLHHEKAGLGGRDSIGYAAKTLNTASVNRVNSADEIVKAGMI